MRYINRKHELDVSLQERKGGGGGKWRMKGEWN